MRYAIALGLRGLTRHPRTMALAVLLLALGLAAVTCMLTLLSMLSGDPLPGVSENLYLATADSRQAERGTESADPDRDAPQFLWKLDDARAMMATFPQARQAALMTTPLQLRTPDGARSRNGHAVLAEGPMPAMFGVPLRSGRFWTPQEAAEGARVVVVDEATSVALLGTADGVGRDLRIGEGLFRVIGVGGAWAPQPRFHFLQPADDAWRGRGADIAFLPVRAALDAGVAPVGSRQCDDHGVGGFGFDRVDLGACRWLALWAELRGPEDRKAYAAALAAFAQARHEAGAWERAPATRLYGVREWLAANRVVPDSVRLNLWLALGLLALCMVNVAGLLAARFLRRAGELGVRRVLGAPRRSVVVQCLVEAGTAGVAGGLLALPLTLFGLWVIRLQDHGYTDLARLDLRLSALLMALSLAVGLLVGLLPALRAARLAPVLQVKSL
ncbi:ABC transporter permease [Luteimonas huabeiensis]|uniref:ABC transporter permease n=1 Tax=Luteimonas huabeiensis TaxID=1244513 RepID=UPI000463455F|nr:ABC transporter permease [Luteimonas huabeiensis]